MKGVKKARIKARKEEEEEKGRKKREVYMKETSSLSCSTSGLICMTLEELKAKM